MIRILMIGVMLAGCQTMNSEVLITPKQCKRSCYPHGMLNLDAVEGICKCRGDRSE